MGRTKTTAVAAEKPQDPAKAKKRSSQHSKAGLKFPVSRVRNTLRTNLKGYYLSALSPITNTSLLQEAMRAFIKGCIAKMSEKDLAKAVIKPTHCADALADSSTDFAGIFPIPVAGLYRKRE